MEDEKITLNNKPFPAHHELGISRELAINVRLECLKQAFKSLNDKTDDVIPKANELSCFVFLGLFTHPRPHP